MKAAAGPPATGNVPYITGVIHTSQPEHLLIEIRRKGRQPRPEFFSYEGLKNTRQSIPCSIALKACGLIN
jgi:hypothetical protein